MKSDILYSPDCSVYPGDEQLDAELMEWIQEAHDKKSVVNQAGQLPI